MTETTETYEKLRLLLSPQGFIPLPKHEQTEKLLTNLYSDEEAELVTTCFKEFRGKVSFEEIKALTGIPEKKLGDMMTGMLRKGKIRVEGETDYYMLAYLPGVFEDYFTLNRDDPQKMKLVAEAHRALQKIGFSPDIEFPLTDSPDFTNEAGWRFVPAVESVVKTLDINETIDTEHKILPFEILGEYLGGYDVFSVTRCSCRNMAEMAGEPCKRTSENFCVQAGPSAEAIIKAGVGKQLNYDEVMDVLSKAAEAGLVHSTLNMQKPSSFI